MSPRGDSQGAYPEILISVSDGKASTSLDAFTIDVLAPPLGREDIQVNDTTGDVVIDSGGNQTTLPGAKLNFEYDAADHLVNVTGTSMLPPSISNYLSVDAPIEVQVGYYSGARINQDESIGIHSTGGIQLVDDFMYFVFFIGGEVGITVKDDSNPNQVPVTLGLGEAQNLIIMDPADPFGYVFGYVNGTGFGTGRSLHSLIPYASLFDNSGPDTFPALDSFYGSKVDKGVFGLGIKVFDLMSLTGTRVVRSPQFSDIDWTDPLNSSVHYQAGFNGAAELEFGVLGIGLFSYHLADASATLDVGLQRQHFALQGVYQPDETSQPVWLPVRPSPEPFDKVVMNAVADGNGEYAIELKGQFQSRFPDAKLYGSMRHTKDGLSMNGRIGDGENAITMTATANNEVFDARVNYARDINAQLKQDVVGDMDRLYNEQLAMVTEQLQSALQDYEFEFSLRGLRQQLPSIVDDAIARLQTIPGIVRGNANGGVYKVVYEAIYNKQICFNLPTPLPDVCVNARDYVNEASIATTAADNARTAATNHINPIIASLQDLKQRALEQADSETLRTGLQAALMTAYNNRTFNRTYSYTFDRVFSYDYGVGTATKRWNETFSYTANVVVLQSNVASNILTAANNVYRIGETDSIRISLRGYLDNLPTDSIYAKARQQVQDGLSKVPGFEGAGYQVTIGEQQKAYIQLDGKQYMVEFNLLDPTNVHDNIVALVSQTLLEPPLQ